MDLANTATADFPEDGLDFEQQIAQTEKRFLELALGKSGGVRTRAADLLKISYRSFRHYAKKHSL
jgi:two-component system response regulator PilR (NtrC family)